MKNARIACAGCLVAAFLVGCGGGGGTKSPAASPQSGQTGDFSLSLDQASVSSLAGGITPQVTLQVTPTSNFTGAISLTAKLPAGLNCFNNSCSAFPSAPSFSVRLQFIASRTLAAGTYQINFVGTGAGLTHQIELSVNISAAPPITPNRSALVATDDFFQFDPVFDAAHHVVYAPDMQDNVVDVISTRTHQIVQQIPVPSPDGLDISTDGRTLYVGSNTQYLYVVDTAKLIVIDRVRLPDSNDSTIFPMQVAALSNGQVLLELGCGRVNACTTATALSLFDPISRSFSPVPLGSLDSVGFMSRSADHSSVYIAAGDSGASIARYDAATGTLVHGQLIFGNFVNALVASPDKTRLAALINCCELDLLDANFNVIEKYANGMDDFSAPLFSTDSSRLYVATSANGRKIHVFSSDNLTFLGDIPSVLEQGVNNTILAGWDDDQHLIGYTYYSVIFVDASMQPSSLPMDVPIYRFGIFANSALTPDNPASGLDTALNGAAFTETPLISFNGTAANNVELTDTNTIKLGAPSLPGSRDVDVLATFPSGYFLLAPSSYSYGPRIAFTDGEASGENDAGKLTLYGYGFDFSPSQLTLTVAGSRASNLQVNGAANSFSPTPLYSITADVPPGVPGQADVVLTTPIGAASLQRAFHYVHRSDYALSTGASPFQMIYDSAGNRLFWTDSSTNSVVVFSIASRSIVSQIPVGLQPLGLSLTPDGSKLLVITFGDKQLVVIDTATLQVVTKIATPFDSTLVSLDPRPIYIAATANGKAFLLNTVNGFSCLNLYEYDLAAATFVQRKDVGFCPLSQASVAAVSSDGSHALIGGWIYSAASDSFTPLINGSDSSPRALSADGSSIVTFRAFHSLDGARSGIANAPDQIKSDLDENSVSGEKLNATGSLLFFPEKDRIRIFDARHGKLVRTLMVPDGVLSGVDCLVVDPVGRTLWVMTTRGLSQFTFDSDPLAIGEVQGVNGQITVLGSGFDATSQLLVDGSLANTVFVDNNHLASSIGGLPAGNHQVSVKNGNGDSYVLDLAFTSQ